MVKNNYLFPLSSILEITEVAQEMWEDLDDDTRRTYRQTARAEHEKYREARLQYECGLTDEQRGKQILTSERTIQRKSRRKLNEVLIFFDRE